MITHNVLKSKEEAFVEEILNKYSSNNSHIVADWCYQRVMLRNRPDFVAIVILAELMSLRHNFVHPDYDFELSNCFTYFASKLNIKSPQVKTAALRLERLGLVTRSFRRIAPKGSSFDTEMDLQLNSASVAMIAAEERW